MRRDFAGHLEEILVPLLEHFAARGDGRVLPVLLAARRGWERFESTGVGRGCSWCFVTESILRC